MSDLTKDGLAAIRHWRASHVQVGDVVAYTGGVTKPPTERDWLKVSRIDEEGIHGYRIHPQEWEREIEYVVVNRQIEAHGVLVHD